jgi:hypothetical protein
MPGQTLQTDAFVLSRRPPSDSFQTWSVFSAEHGVLLALQRVPRQATAGGAPKKKASATIALDLFDEVSLLLESSNQGHTWFVKEARLLQRHAAIGRTYECLRAASELATLIARNPVQEESRANIVALLRAAFEALQSTDRPDIVSLKSLYRFARDEGYPVKQEWFPTLPPADRTQVSALLNQPLTHQTATAEQVRHLRSHLETYLRGHTEILLE